MKYWDDVDNVIRKADIVLMIVDARMPEMSRNEKIEGIVERNRKKLIYVFNKIDLVNRKDLEEIRNKYGEDSFFVSGVNNIGISKLKDGIFIAANRLGIELPHVGVVGYPNVGKSAIINALSHRAKTAVSSIAGTTKGIQWVKAGKLRIIDSPGVIPLEERGENEKMGILGARNPEQFDSPEIAAYEVIRMFLKKDRKKLEEFYGIIVETEDESEILVQIGKKRGFLKRGGVVDEHKTGIQILRDWQKGKIRI